MKAGNRMRARVAALMGMISEGNDKFKIMIDRLTNNPDEYVAKPRKGSHRKYWPNTPNPKRRATKTLNGTIFHMGHPRGNGIPRVPTQDEIRIVEHTMDTRVIIKGGLCVTKAGNAPVDWRAIVKTYKLERLSICHTL